MLSPIGELMNCPICESNQLTKKGTVELASGTIKQRYKCKDCGEHFSVAHVDDTSEDMFAEEVEHVFDVTDVNALKNKHVVLIDDVITTGATIEACCNVLQKIEGIKISVLSIAFAVK